MFFHILSGEYLDQVANGYGSNRYNFNVLKVFRQAEERSSHGG